MLRVLEGEIGGAAEGKIGRRRSGEMELCSLNMDVIFRAEQKERRNAARMGDCLRERGGETLSRFGDCTILWTYMYIWKLPKGRLRGRL